jgi:hypothetical protein
MISHHDASAFARYADRIYQLTPQADNQVKVSLIELLPAEMDSE